jgi:hypothetical protein
VSRRRTTPQQKGRHLVRASRDPSSQRHLVVPTEAEGPPVESFDPYESPWPSSRPIPRPAERVMEGISGDRPAEVEIARARAGGAEAQPILGVSTGQRSSRKGPKPEEEYTQTDRIKRTGIKRASAARALAVGLLCFGIWTVFDANQLYHNALGSPFGTRRTVSLTILRPIKDLTNALGLSGPVNAADSALNRDGASSSATLPTLPVFAGDGVRPPNDAGVNGIAPMPHSGSGHAAPGVTPPPSAWPPPVAQPTLSHPLVMLDIGDSIGEDLGYGLAAVFGGDPYVDLIQKGQVDTGLSRPSYFNWPAALEADLKQYRPGVVIIMMGANDDSALELANGGSVAVGTPQWDAQYRHRILLLLAEAVSTGAHVLWVGLPPVQNSAVTPAFAQHVNALAQQLANSTPGASYVPSWSLLAGPNGQFVQYKQVDGSIQQIRYSDGVHLAPAGWDLLASYLLDPMAHLWHVNLHAKPIMTLGS